MVHCKRRPTLSDIAFLFNALLGLILVRPFAAFICFILNNNRFLFLLSEIREVIIQRFQRALNTVAALETGLNRVIDSLNLCDLHNLCNFHHPSIISVIFCRRINSPRMKEEVIADWRCTPGLHDLVGLHRRPVHDVVDLVYHTGILELGLLCVVIRLWGFHAGLYAFLAFFFLFLLLLIVLPLPRFFFIWIIFYWRSLSVFLGSVISYWASNLILSLFKSFISRDVLGKLLWLSDKPIFGDPAFLGWLSIFHHLHLRGDLLVRAVH